MYQGAKVAVVMPAYNVEHHIEAAARTVPAFVDLLIVVNDASTDATAERLRRVRREQLVVLHHLENRGVGAAIASGYAEAARRGVEVIAVMAGDGQMDPDELGAVLDPVVQGVAEYAKGNRFARGEAYRVMPRSRLIGNVLLSLLTKLTSGYRHIFDSQCGYTAISAHGLAAIGGQLFARYGYPNDVLARLNIVGARVVDVPVRPIYDGQPSGIRLRTVFYPVLFVLLRSFFVRMVRKHLFLRFGRAPHPPLPALPARGPRMGEPRLASDGAEQSRILVDSQPAPLRRSRPAPYPRRDAHRPADHFLPAPPR